MENENKEIKQVYSLIETPWYFGAYLNMMRHNIYLISNEISDKFNLNQKMENEAKIRSSFLKNKDFLYLNNPNLLYSNIIRYLPVAKTFSSDLISKELREDVEFSGVDINSMCSFFNLAFAELNDFRNEYSHFYSIKDSGKRKITIDENLAVHLRQIFNYALAFTKARFQNVLPESSFKWIDKNISTQLFDQNNNVSNRGLVFFCNLFLDKENAFHFFNKVTGFKDTRTLEFLATREVFTVFCVKLPHDKFVSDNPKQALQLDILNYLNRAPKPLFNVLNEEAKKVFLPNLSNLTKQNIVENSIAEFIEEENYDDYINSISTLKRSDDRFTEFALKYLDESDNFNFFFQIQLGKLQVKSYPKTVLNIISNENNRTIVKDITTFGKLSDFIENDSKDSVSIKEKIVAENTFIEQFKDGKFDHFTQYSPKYNITNNKIGIIIPSPSDDLYRNTKASAFISINELPKIVLLEILEKRSSFKLITNFITRNSKSIYNRAFIEEVKSKLGFDKTLYKSFFDERLKVLKADENIENKLVQIITDIEALKKSENQNFGTLKEIKAKNAEKKALNYANYVYSVNQRKNKLNEILEEHGLNDKQIPSKIINYWLNIKNSNNETVFKNKIRAEKNDCKQRLKDLENGKAPKIGEIATFLARDIVKLVINKEVKSKITSFYYDLIQESLALFADETKKTLFIELCNRELNLFDKEKGHPFLADIKIKDITKTKELYKEYLIFKGTKTKTFKEYNRKSEKFIEKPIPDSWLENTFYSKSSNDVTSITIPENKNNLPLYYQNLVKESCDLDTWLISVKKGNSQNPNPKPIDLPTNLFDEKLIELLKQKVKHKLVEGEKYNFSKLMALWQNNTQPFYNEKRHYTIFKDKDYESNVKFNPLEGKKFSSIYASAISETFNKRRKIDFRIQKIQIAQVFKKGIDENEKTIRHYQLKDRITLLMLSEMIGADLDFSLNEISPKAKQNPLDIQIPIKQTVGNKQIIDTRKRKDFSVFKKLMHDRRLQALFEYISENEIQYLVLRNQLHDYDRVKETIFKSTFELEESIVNVMSSEELSVLSHPSNSNFQFQKYLDWLKKYKMIDDKGLDFLKELRNKFSHNQFPSKSVVENFMILDFQKSLSPQIANSYIELTTSLINKIKN
jgi:hypothetical protein